MYGLNTEIEVNMFSAFTAIYSTLNYNGVTGPFSWVNYLKRGMETLQCCDVLLIETNNKTKFKNYLSSFILLCHLSAKCSDKEGLLRICMT